MVMPDKIQRKNPERPAVDKKARATKIDGSKDVEPVAPRSQKIPGAKDELDAHTDDRHARRLVSTVETKHLDLALLPRQKPADVSRQGPEIVPSNKEGRGLSALGGNRIEWPEAKKWLQLHSLETQPLAKAILRNIERIPETLYDRGFDCMVDDLRTRKNLGIPLLAFTQDFSGTMDKPREKSNDWVTRRVNEKIPGVISSVLYAYLPTKMLGSLASPFIRKVEEGWLRHSGKHADIVLLDDAAYSGSQMVNVMTSSLGSAARAGVSVDHVYIGCVCMTKFAQSRVRETFSRMASKKGATLPKLHFLGKPILIPTLADLGRSGRMTPKQVRDAISQYGADRNHDGLDAADVLTLTYLPHKVPDERSALARIMAEGLVNNSGAAASDREEYKEFIPWTVPPYSRR
jgi:hypothetical protein